MKKCKCENCTCEENKNNPTDIEEVMQYIKDHPDLARAVAQHISDKGKMSPPMTPVPKYRMSSSDCFDDEENCLIAPASTNVPYEHYISAVIAQILNLSTLCGQPALVAGNKNTGITTVTNEIYLDMIQRLIDDPFFETVGYCDGIRSTLLKLNGRQIGAVII